MSHALVLNASFEPLHVVTWQRALQLLFQGKVEVIEESEREVRTVRLTIKVPAVLRLLTYVPLSRKRGIVRFSRANIFLRDQNICQYCNRAFNRNQLTLDHIIPIVQGGRKSWENIVTACKGCNQRKGGRTPAQAGMQLLKKPKQPVWLPGSNLATGPAKASNNVSERWNIYLKLDRNKGPRMGIEPEDDKKSDPGPQKNE